MWLNPDSTIYELRKTSEMGSTVTQRWGYFATVFFFVHPVISNSFKCVYRLYLKIKHITSGHHTQSDILLGVQYLATRLHDPVTFVRLL